MYLELIGDHTKTIWERSSIFFSLQNCRQLNLTSGDVIGDVVHYDFDNLLKGRISNRKYFGKFIRDYLANDDRYGKSNYCH